MLEVCRGSVGFLLKWHRDHEDSRLPPATSPLYRRSAECVSKARLSARTPLDGSYGGYASSSLAPLCTWRCEGPGAELMHGVARWSCQLPNFSQTSELQIHLPTARRHVGSLYRGATQGSRYLAGPSCPAVLDDRETRACLLSVRQPDWRSVITTHPFERHVCKHLVPQPDGKFHLGLLTAHAPGLAYHDSKHLPCRTAILLTDRERNVGCAAS